MQQDVGPKDVNRIFIIADIMLLYEVQCVKCRVCLIELASEGVWEGGPLQRYMHAAEPELFLFRFYPGEQIRFVLSCPRNEVHQKCVECVTIPQFLDEGTPDIIPGIIPNENEGYPALLTTEVRKSIANLCLRSHSCHIPEPRHMVVKDLAVLPAGIP